MKNFLCFCLFVLLLSAGSAEAQISRGSHLVGGNFGFMSQHTTLQYDRSRSSSTVSFLDLEGSYTYLLTDRLGLGGRVMLSRIGGQSDGDKASFTSLVLMPNVRYYIYQRDRFHAYLNGGVGLGLTTDVVPNAKTQDSYYMLGSSIGFQHFLTEVVGWGVQLNTDYVLIDGQPGYPDFGLAIGFTFNLGKH